MQAKFNPLQVIINPPGIQFGMPGDTIELYIVVINQGDQSAVIDLYFVFDEVFQSLTGWSSSPRESLALAPQQNSDEVKFEFQIAANALPGTYDYTLVVDSPQHYPQDTPITFPNQIKVLLKEQTSIRVNDPTFSLRPNTNPNKPLVFNPSEFLQVEVIVDNRSYLVDRFRLSCPDLDEDWFTINYPTTGFEGTGLVSDVTALELNPGTQGQILLKFHPPGDTLAGSYSPTIRLYSENSPDLVLLDLVYIQIPTNYRLDIELNTILGQVSRSLGKYELSLTNQGNIVRELILDLKSRDEEELYTYKFDPTEVRLLPNRSAVANLTVKPRPWWRRPWFGAGLVVNFQLDIKDQENFPLPNTLPQGSLVWKPRPWWQFLLLILAILGLLGGIGFIIWRILNPDPLRLENFSANNPRITEEEDEVALKWDIHNYQQLQMLILMVKGSQAIQPITYDFRNGIPETLGKASTNEIPPCQVQEKQELICSNVKTGVKTKGNYTFELQAFYRNGIEILSPKTQVVSQTTQVEIAEKQIAEVLSFQTDKLQYIKGQNILLSWIIARPLLLAKAQLAGSADDGTSYSEPITYKFNQGNLADPKLKKLCTQQNQQLRCTNIPLTAYKAGKFGFEIKAFPNNGSDKVSAKKTESKIEILPKPFKIVSFTINGSEQQNLELKEGTTATLSWRVEGENIQVKLQPYGDDVPLAGSKQLPVNLAFPSQISLQVNDISGKQQPQQRGFAITVIKKVVPTPIPSINPIPPPLPPNNSPFKSPLPLRQGF
ncbi:COG1470 family protein [Nostoc sp.]|uniref:COG1470 family protein n=1 Tax=Nostoc sp. TaxID=1180 RepID=UPI002FFA2F92